MSLVLESFHTAGVRCGVLLRSISSDRMDTLLVFQSPGAPLVHLEQTTWFEADTLEWTRYRFVDQHDGFTSGRARDSAAGTGASAVPSYFAHQLLLAFLATPAVTFDFEQFPERNPTRPVRARFVRGEREELQTPGQTATAQHVGLEVGGAATNSFWVDGGRVLKSDWNGAESYPAPGVDEVVHGLAPSILRLVEAFVS